MPRWAIVVLSLVAGAAVIVGLGFAFLGTSDEGTEGEAGTIRITVRDGEPVGGIQHVTVQQGDEVKIEVESDVSEEIHVHGYDLMQDVEAGETAELEFRATIPGRFELELEHSGTPIAELEVSP